MEYLTPPWCAYALPWNIDTPVEYLSTSVEYLKPPWNMQLPPWNISYLRETFQHLRGIFDTSVECLSTSMEYFIPPWNI